MFCLIYWKYVPFDKPIPFFFRCSEQHGNKTHEQRLLDYLLQDYKNRRLIRPVKDRSKPVVIRLSAELIGVAKVVRNTEN